jgi:hypothetical protein
LCEAVAGPLAAPGAKARLKPLDNTEMHGGTPLRRSVDGNRGERVPLYPLARGAPARLIVSWPDEGHV